MTAINSVRRMNVAKPVVLIVLDGWGINMQKEGNAIAAAKTPVYTALAEDCPHTQLQASGEASAFPRARWAIPRSAI